MKNHLAMMIRETIDRYPDKPALRWKEDGAWRELSFRQMGERILDAAKGLLELGLPEGGPTAIFSANKPGFTIADFATLSVRGVSVPIYATNTARQAEYIVNDAQIPIVFVGGKDQYDKVRSFFDGSAWLKKIIVFDRTVDIRGHEPSMYFDDFLALGRESSRGAEVEARLAEAGPDELATLIYTSGTTEEPKGVMLCHSNFHACFVAHEKRLDVSEKDVSLCFLPLTHVFERAWTFFALVEGMTNNYCDDTTKVVEYLKEVRPTVMCAVPRFYEKIYSTVFERLESAPPLKRKLFRWAVATGEQVYLLKKEAKAVPPLLALKHKIADKLVLAKLREVVGGRIRYFPAAGAPLSRKIEEFFHSAGIFIACGYGLTETTATVTCHENTFYRPGTVGKPISGVEIKIAANGEILVKGSTVMKGYYRKPQATAEVFEDGWFRTGDVGVIEDGYLTITDRIKDLMKTSGGKYIAPQLIETTIGKDYFIEQIAVIGDLRKYVSALIVPAFPALEEYAKSKGISFASHEELVAKPEIVRFYQERIDQNSGDLAGFERIKKFTLLARPFSQDAGEMTPTMKLKRKAINEKFRDLIDGMYRER
jgi:long-chain acyl-CoA synthetase